MYRYIIPPIFILLYVVVGILVGYDFFIAGEKWLTIVSTLFLIAGAASGLIGCFMGDSPLKNLIQAANNIWLGIFIYFTMIYGVVRIVFYVLGRNGEPFLMMKRHAVVAICVLLAIGCNVYGFLHEHRLYTTHYDIATDAPHFTNKSMRIALIADLHLGVNTKHAVIDNMVNEVLRQEPDVILVAGDIFNSTYYGMGDPEPYIASLKKLKAPLGVFGVYGNHDNVEPLLCGFPMAPLKDNSRPAVMDEFMEKCGIKMLNDEVIRFDKYGVTLIGRQSSSKTGDGNTPRATIETMFDDVDLEDELIVLQHEPVEIKGLAAAGAHMALMGHTHDGQFFPGNIFSRLSNRYCYGHKTKNQLEAITTSGVGFYGPPIRIGTKSEIVIIDLTSTTTAFNNC